MTKRIVTIVGGGSTYTPGVVKALLSKKESFKVDEIRVYDIDEQRQNDVSLIVKNVINEMAPETIFTVTINPEIAFKDADFIFAQMRVGKYAMREKDEKIPLKYGAVGQETCGCGGLAYGLRTIFPMVEMLDYVAKYAKPNHWILNYSNPASIVAEGLRRLRPEARIINICDMPVAIMESMAEILQVPSKKIVPNYFGLNHFGWFTNIYVDGVDRLPELREHVLKCGYLSEEPDEQHSDDSWTHTYLNAKYLTEMFPDYLPNTYLQYYLLSDYIVQNSNPNYTRTNEVMDGREKLLFDAIKEYKETGVFNKKSFKVGVHGAFIIDVAEALTKDGNGRYLLIVENNGAISNLPNDAMVEIPCYVSKRGIERINVGNVPMFYKGLLEQQLSCEKLLVDAAIEGSYKKALQAFAMNKTIKSSFQAKAILDEMIEANKEYWPEMK